MTASFGLGDGDGGPGYLLEGGDAPGMAGAEDCPPPGCCDGGGGDCPLWRRVVRCNGTFIYRWICDGAQCLGGGTIVPGTVIAHEGFCWRVQSVTDPSPPDHLRFEPDFFPCFPDCQTCQDPPGCCPENLLCDVGPDRVEVDQTINVHEYTLERFCGDCTLVTLPPYSQPSLPGTLETIIRLCVSETDAASNRNQAMVGDPCSQFQTERVSTLQALYGYNLLQTIEADHPPGSNFGNRAVIGTTATPRPPVLYASVVVGHGVGPYGETAIVRAAVSTFNPGKWWLDVTMGGVSIDLDGSSVAASAGCGGAMAVVLNARSTRVSSFCFDQPFRTSLRMDVNALFRGFVNCSGSAPEPPPLLTDLAAAEIIAQQMRLGGCAGCGDGFAG